MLQAMMPTPSGTDRTGQVIEATRALSLAFLDTPTSFLASNRSLVIVVSTLAKRWARAARNGRELELLSRWQERAGNARERVLQDAESATGGTWQQPVPVLNETLSARLVSFCADPPDLP